MGQHSHEEWLPVSKQTRNPRSFDLSEVMIPPPKQVGTVMRSFRNLLLNMRLYTPEHPVVMDAAQQWLNELKPFHAHEKPLVLQSTDQYLQVNGCTPTVPGETMDYAVMTSTFLRTRGITSIAFLPQLSREELIGFCGLLYKLPDNANRSVDVDNALQTRSIVHIAVNFNVVRNMGAPDSNANVVSSRLDIFHSTGDASISGSYPMPSIEDSDSIEIADVGSADVDLNKIDFQSFDFSSVAVHEMDFTGHKHDTFPEGFAFWNLWGPQLDSIQYDFSVIEDDPNLSRWDPVNLLASRRFVAYASGAGFRKFDTFVRTYLEVALEGQDSATRHTVLRELIGRYSTAISQLPDAQEKMIFTQRMASLVLDLPPDVIARFLAYPLPQNKGLREQTLKGLVHADQLASRVVQELAFRSSKTDDPDLFMLICEALETLIPGRIADGDLEPALSSLKVVDHLRMSQHTSLIIRSRANQLLRWLCRPELVDRLLLGCIDADVPIVRRSNDILMHLGPNVGDLLLSELKRSQNPRIRLSIVDIVARLLSQEHSITRGAFNRTFRSILLEIEHADDHPWYYVRNLLLVIRKIGDDRFLDWIARFLDNEDPRVRQEAIVACAEMDTPASRRVLRSVAEGVELDTADALSAIVTAFRNDPDFNILQFLMQVADESPVLAVRLAAVERFAPLPGKAVIDALDQVLNRKRGLIGRKPYYPDELRAAAVLELRRRDDTDAAKALRDLPLDPSERVRSAGEGVIPAPAPQASSPAPAPPSTEKPPWES